MHRYIFAVLLIFASPFTHANVMFEWLVSGAAAHAPTDILASSAEQAAKLGCSYEVGTQDITQTSYSQPFPNVFNFRCYDALHGYIVGNLSGAVRLYSCDGKTWNQLGQSDDSDGLEQRCAGIKSDNCPCVGNPISPGNGAKVQVEPDFIGAGPNPLRLERTYNSRVANPGSIGPFWRTNFDRRIVATASGSSSTSVAFAERADGRTLSFSAPAISTSPWLSDADISDLLWRTSDASGNTTGWTLYWSSSEDYETYDSSGRLTRVTSRTGMAQTLAYDAQGRLATVSDQFGRSIAFTYGANGLISTVTDPNGGVYQYNYVSYDITDVLQSVTYPGGASRTYTYGTGDLRFRLMSIADELGVTYATFTYDASTGRALSTEHAGHVENYTITQVTGNPDTNNSTATATLVDPLGASRTLSYSVILNAPRFTGSSAPCNHCSGVGRNSAVTYDSSANVLSRTDFNGSKTCYQYNGRNLETARVEGATSTEDCSTVLATLPSRDDVRKISTVWHSNWRLPVAIFEPKRKTTFVYAGDPGASASCVPSSANVLGLPLAVVCSKTVEETSDSSGQTGTSAQSTGNAQTRSYTYNEYGQLLSANDGNGTTIYSYYSASDPDLGKRGNLQTVTDPVGNITTWTSYDPAGRPTAMQDPNGTVTTMSYKPRGWLESRSVAGEITRYDYDDSGQLTKVTTPDGSYLSYQYDPAHRLTGVQDTLGNKVLYTLDELGNRQKEEYYDSTGALLRVVNRVYDSLNQLHQTIGYR